MVERKEEKKKKEKKEKKENNNNEGFQYTQTRLPCIQHSSLVRE
jgi:hypothetical protein